MLGASRVPAPSTLITFPSADLCPWVRCYVVRDETAHELPTPTFNHCPSHAGATLTAVLSGSWCAIDADGREHGSSPLFLTGPLTRPKPSISHDRVRSITVLFMPGTWTDLAPAAPGELTDVVVTGDALWGYDARDLLERLHDAPSLAHCVAEIEGLLRRRLLRRHARARLALSPVEIAWLRNMLPQQSPRAVVLRPALFPTSRPNLFEAETRGLSRTVRGVTRT